LLIAHPQQEGGTGLAWYRVGFSGRGENVGKVEKVWEAKYYVHIYASGKMIPVESIPGMGRDKGE
jgi:hypothetical protein